MVNNCDVVVVVDVVVLVMFGLFKLVVKLDVLNSTFV